MTIPRCAAEIEAMRDGLYRQLLAGAEQVRPAWTTLAWTRDVLIPDSEMLDLIEADEEDTGPNIDVRRTLEDLVDCTAPGDEDDIKMIVKYNSTDYVRELAAAARKIDRLCKAELKARDGK